MADYTYRECLRDGMQTNQNLSADDIRSLCKEITARPEPHYGFVDGELKPLDDFTKCYDKAVKEMADKNDDKEIELAKILCYYEPK